MSDAAGQDGAAGTQRAGSGPFSTPDLKNQHAHADLLCLQETEVRRSSGQSWGAGGIIVWHFVQTSPVPGPHISQVYDRV